MRRRGLVFLVTAVLAAPLFLVAASSAHAAGPQDDLTAAGTLIAQARDAVLRMGCYAIEDAGAAADLCIEVESESVERGIPTLRCDGATLEAAGKMKPSVPSATLRTCARMARCASSSEA